MQAEGSGAISSGTVAVKAPASRRVEERSTRPKFSGRKSIVDAREGQNGVLFPACVPGCKSIYDVPICRDFVA